MQEDHPKTIHDLIKAKVPNGFSKATVIYPWSHHHVSHEVGDNDGDDPVIRRPSHRQCLLGVLKLRKTSGNPVKVCLG
jgi:hypothetical protein